ncbi:hypothetical protein CA234_03600 [Sphingomonas sp. ABOLE]|nr:hypothetical protein CA234_03600 [Sphingomonas sp. ABOLE]
MQIARLRQRDASLSITRAVGRLICKASDADVRRIRRKWRARGERIAAHIDLIEDTVALNSLPCSHEASRALLERLEALPERQRYERLDATAIIALACSIRFPTLLDELNAIRAEPALGMVRRLGRGRNFKLPSKSPADDVKQI